MSKVINTCVKVVDPDDDVPVIEHLYQSLGNFSILAVVPKFTVPIVPFDTLKNALTPLLNCTLNVLRPAALANNEKVLVVLDVIAIDFDIPWLEVAVFSTNLSASKAPFGEVLLFALTDEFDLPH